MANLVVNTPQNVNLYYRLVSVGERILGFFIDLFVLSLYLYIIEQVTGVIDAIFDDNWTVFGLQQFLFLPAMFYSLYMHILFQGRTIGKFVMKTKVVKLDGTPVRWNDYLTLWMLRIVDIWMFLGSIGLLTTLFSEKNQRVGDMAAGTAVISVKKKVKISHTILEEVTKDYEPTFHKVIELSDKDVRLIKETYQIALKSNDFKTLNMLRKKVASLLNIESKLYDKQFLDTILKDYNHFTQHM